jgi:hypothetical protein
VIAIIPVGCVNLTLSVPIFQSYSTSPYTYRNPIVIRPGVITPPPTQNAKALAEVEEGIEEVAWFQL